MDLQTDPWKLEGRLKKTTFLKGEEKLNELREIWRCIRDIEKAALTDYSIGLEVLRKARSLLPDVESGIRRLTRAEKKAA